MTPAWQLQWTAPAVRGLRSIPWQQAARVDAAVQSFARTGDGDLVRLPADHAVTLRLRVAPYFVVMTADRMAHLLTVRSIYRL
jgi:hypothetical protein